jgi:hypothetical protein
MRATCPSNVTDLDIFTEIIFGEEYNGAPHDVVFSILVLRCLS